MQRLCLEVVRLSTEGAELARLVETSVLPYAYGVEVRNQDAEKSLTIKTRWTAHS